MNKPSAIICDLDGTLCNHEHRLHYVEAQRGKLREGEKWKKNWPAFFDAMDKDTPNEWCLELLMRLVASLDGVNHLHLFFLTGRPERYREKTLTWIHKHYADEGGSFDYKELYMKSDSKCKYGDQGAWISGAEFKKLTYIDLIKPYYNVLFALDDNEECCQMWKEQGVVCLQVK